MSDAKEKKTGNVKPAKVPRLRRPSMTDYRGELFVQHDERLDVEPTPAATMSEANAIAEEQAAKVGGSHTVVRVYRMFTGGEIAS